ncbi:retrovirus-related pol polyprotein from transposon TNT 1-94 [Tanacetum coccineum]
MDRGFDVFFNSKNKTCTVIKDGEVMVKSSMTENRMFPVDFSCDNIYGLMSSKEETTNGCRSLRNESIHVKEAKRAEEKLELVHADICGPMKTDSYAGKAFGFFKKFKALAKNQSYRKLKVLRTDKGGEFLSKEFSGFSNEQGIKRELTAPYTPE